MSIRVIIAGFKGKMGQAACQMVLADPDLALVAVLDPFESESEWKGIPVFNKLYFIRTRQLYRKICFRWCLRHRFLVFAYRVGDFLGINETLP